MALIIDFLLLAASGGACFYCWVLSKRLKALTSTKDGFHTGIAALSQSAEDMQTTLKKTQEIAGENSARLEQLLRESDEKISELRDFLTDLDKIRGALTTEPPHGEDGDQEGVKFYFMDCQNADISKGEAA